MENPLEKTKIKKEIDLPKLVKVSLGYTGAEIEAVVQDSLITCLHTKSSLTTEILTEHLLETTPLSRMSENKIKALREWANLNGARRVEPKKTSSQLIKDRRRTRRVK